MSKLLDLAIRQSTPPPRKQISIRLPPDVHERLEKVAADAGVSINELVSNLVALALDDDKGGDK